MRPDRAERLAAIVEEALDQPADARTAFVADACDDDTQLRREAESLLNRAADAADFIETPAARVDPELLAAEPGVELQAGETVGIYKIRSLIGAGGMGEVYLAEDSSLGRDVALKLVRPGVATRAILARFRREERILAGLNHPHIARIYGGGMTERGLPYFVMEYVVGHRLDVFCSKENLTTASRLRLFEKVCAAVSYAHRRLVVHRDLKPGNILVTPEGEPKLLDFGIATLLDQDAPSSETITARGVLTPDYASPEQLRGEPVTTATDVYSLGVVLHELLTGNKPSAGVPADKTVQQLAGDLKNIVRMALRAEPERRYSSAAEFGADIERYLNNLPVIARRDSVGYRMRKFVARNRIAVAAAIVTLLSLLAGIVATVCQTQIAQAERSKAERRFNDVRRLANSFLFEMHDAIEKLPGSTAARELLVKRALEYLDNLATEARGDNSLLRELVFAYVKVGNVQGNPNNANLGDANGALASYRKAESIAQQLATDDAQSSRPLAIVLEKRADVLAASGDITGAVTSARASLAIFDRIAQARPDDANARQSLAISYIKVGDVSGNPNFPNANDTASAVSSYRRSLAIWEDLKQSDPSNSRVHRSLGVVHERIGTMALAANRIDEALTELRASLAIRDDLAASNPADSDAIRDAAIIREKLATALTLGGDLEGALVNRRDSLSVFQRLADSDPMNVQARVSLSISHFHMAELLAKPNGPNLNRPAEALEHCRKGLDLVNSVNADKPNATSRSVASDLEQLASALARK